MASDNVTSLAAEKKYWDPKSGEAFDFTYAYNPAGRTSLGCRRRGMAALSRLAAVAQLDANAENYPFSVKPDHKVGVPDILAIFRDVYDETPYDMTRGVTVVNRKGERSRARWPAVRQQRPARIVQGPRERTIACPAATYVQITQSRASLPDPSAASSGWATTTRHDPAHALLLRNRAHAGILYGRRAWGYRDDCAWWAYRTVGKLANFRWQEMSKDIEKVWRPIEDKAFADQNAVETEAAAIFRKRPGPGPPLPDRLQPQDRRKGRSRLPQARTGLVGQYSYQF